MSFPPGPCCLCLRKVDCYLERILLLTRELEISMLLIFKFMLGFVAAELGFRPSGRVPPGNSGVSNGFYMSMESSSENPQTCFSKN